MEERGESSDVEQAQNIVFNTEYSTIGQSSAALKQHKTDSAPWILESDPRTW